MPKDSKFGDMLAISMDEALNQEEFKNIFRTPEASVELEIENSDITSQAVSDFESFEVFAKKNKKDKKEDDEEEEEDSDEDDKKSNKKKEKSSKDDDEEEDKKSDKKNKKPFPFWLKKKDKKSKDEDDEKSDKKDKKSDKDKKDKLKEKSDKKGKKAKASKCSCSKDCSCKKDSKCPCEGDCTECMSCNDKMFSGAIRYITETFVRTSDVLDNMGLTKGSLATLAALDHIIEEAAFNFNKEANEDDNQVRGADLLLGLDDPEAKEGFSDEMLDDPASSAVLEEILSKHPKLVDEIAPRLKQKFENELVDQLKDRVENRLEDNGIETDLGDHLTEVNIPKAPHPYVNWQERATKPATPQNMELLSTNDETIHAFNSLNNWLTKEAEDENDNLSNEEISNLLTELEKHTV